MNRTYIVNFINRHKSQCNQYNVVKQSYSLQLVVFFKNFLTNFKCFPFLKRQIIQNFIVDMLKVIYNEICEETKNFIY